MPRSRRLPGVLRLLAWLLVLLASMAVVTWRQTVGVAREQALRSLQSERAIADAERMELERRIQALSTRSRLVRVARDRLGMHLPGDAEIILLPVAADPTETFPAAGQLP